MGTLIHLDVPWLASQELCERILNHRFDRVADGGIVFGDSVGTAEIVAITGRWSVL